jgi:hypothetical protein
VAAPNPAESSAFEKWFATFDPSTGVASRAISCTGKPNGFYPDDPDTCSATRYACTGSSNGDPIQVNCPSGQVFDVGVPTYQVNDCVDKYAGKSDACYRNFPAPECTGDNIGYFPTQRCSSLYYLCLEGDTTPGYEFCASTEYFDGACKPKPASPSFCDDPAPEPPTDPDDVDIPPYTCSDKDPNLAYALAKCSVSYYTCASKTTPPIPGSCTAIGAPPGTVFNYKKAPAAASVDSCILSSRVPECN